MQGDSMWLTMMIIIIGSIVGLLIAKRLVQVGMILIPSIGALLLGYGRFS